MIVLVLKAKKMKLANFVGKYVDKAVSQTRGGFIWLTPPPDHTPVDTIDDLIQVIQSSLVDYFNLLFYKSSAKFQKNTYNTVEEIINLAD